jgi:predicted phosphodiesterase
MATDYRGILFIGDPHLASQVPGFRKDDFPRTALDKLRHSLDYAAEQRLLPAILGDLFHYPRDNANWLLGEVIALLGGREVVGIYGNHDCREDSLQDHDSFSVLEKARALRLLDAASPWRGVMNGQPVVLGGSCWGRPLPEGWDQDPGATVCWMTHHDLKVPGYDEGSLRPRELPGIQVLVNGHIHRNLETMVCGCTTWITPGNISRVSRSDASRAHVPAVLRVDIGTSGWAMSRIPIPHAPFEEVFHGELVEETRPGEARSTFISGLMELEALRTAEGAGFTSFLEKNLPQFAPGVQEAIWGLWHEVKAHD